MTLNFQLERTLTFSIVWLKIKLIELLVGA